MASLEQILQNQLTILSWFESFNSNKKNIEQLPPIGSISSGVLTAVSFGDNTYRAPMSLIAEYLKSVSQIRENSYDTIQDMLSDQNNQNSGKVQFVDDIGDTNSNFGYYEFLGTQNSDIDADYRKLSGSEIQALQTSYPLNIFEVQRVNNTSVQNEVQSNLMQIKFDSVSNKIQYIHFGRFFTKILKGYADLLGVASLFIEIKNMTMNRTLLAKVSSFSFTDSSENFYRITFEPTMSADDIQETDLVVVSFSPYENVESSNVNTQSTIVIDSERFAWFPKSSNTTGQPQLGDPANGRIDDYVYDLTFNSGDSSLLSSWNVRKRQRLY